MSCGVVGGISLVGAWVFCAGKPISGRRVRYSLATTWRFMALPAIQRISPGLAGQCHWSGVMPCALRASCGRMSLPLPRSQRPFRLEAVRHGMWGVLVGMLCFLITLVPGKKTGLAPPSMSITRSCDAQSMPMWLSLLSSRRAFLVARFSCPLAPRGRVRGF